jgi:hypothetical protein
MFSFRSEEEEDILHQQAIESTRWQEGMHYTGTGSYSSVIGLDRVASSEVYALVSQINALVHWPQGFRTIAFEVRFRA